MPDPIVMLHPMGASGRIWRGPAGELRRDYQVMTPDLPGHGANTAPFSIARATTEVVQILRGLDRPAHLVGSSLGATVALEAALALPGRVQGLFLSGAMVIAPRTTLAAQRAITAVIPLRLAARFSLDMVDPAVDVDRDTFSDDIRRAGRRTQSRALRDLARSTVADRIPGIMAPTWVCCGDRDRLNMASARLLATRIPGATMKLIHDAGHLWHLQRPRLCADLIREYIASLS
ncbi:alpha/beta fold hydrolase [Stackebrandtia soli]|uniref:alpha/beta fold hydrolase n=1 Tax=Stackebrandtia soli TaxID=1892856 RepID=UPI0039E9A05E